MSRGIVNLAFITNDAKRKKTYTKRMRNFQKKMGELSTLCGVDTCAIISSEYETEPVFWPSKPDVERLVNNYNNMPEIEQTRNQYILSSFSQKRAATNDVHLNRQLKENREKQMKEVMFGCLVGNTVDLDNLDLQDIGDLEWVIDKTMKEIDERIEVLNKGAGPSHVQGTASSADEVVAGEPTQPYGGTGAAGVLMDGQPAQPYGGTSAAASMNGEPAVRQLFGSTNAAEVMAGEPTQPYGGTSAAASMNGEPAVRQLLGSTNAAEVMAGEPTQPYGGTNAIAGEPVQLYGTTNAASYMAGAAKPPYGWGSFTQLLLGDSSSSDDADGPFPGESSNVNAVGGMAGGWSTDAAGNGGASTSDAGGSGV